MPIIYESDMFPGVVFKSYKEAQDAEDSINKSKRQNEAYEALGKIPEMITKPQQEGKLPTYERPQFGIGQGAGVSPKITEAEPYKAPMSPRHAMLESGAYRYMDQPAVQNFAKEYVRPISQEDKLSKQERPTQQSVWEKKYQEAIRINEMPESPEKEAAIENYLMSGATGTYYGLSPEGIDRAGQRASTIEFSKIPGKIAGKEAETKVVDEFEDANKLRKEFNALSKDYKSVRDSYNRVVASGQEPSAAGDLALIFNYMKILDPGSVVRESEFAQAAATGSFGERLKAAGQRLIRGERLSDDMRADFINRAKVLYDKQNTTQRALVDKYSVLASKRGLDPNDVISEVREEVPTFNSEEEARAAGYKNGDYIKIKGLGEGYLE
jgi:hypothetical protein